MPHKLLSLLALSLSTLLAVSVNADIINYRYKVIASYPHNTNVYTQGLVYDAGKLYESAGQFGESRLITRALDDATPLQETPLPPTLFAEGLTLYNDKLFQLTWKSGRAFIYEKKSHQAAGEFHIGGQGWGLTHNHEHLIMSDGSSLLRFLDPNSFEIEKTLPVTYRGKPLRLLNELEWIDGRIFANVWQTDWIVIINPEHGQVEAKVNLKDLLPASLRTRRTDVLNGIAYDALGKRLFVTGKYWPRLYQIELFTADKP